MECLASRHVCHMYLHMPTHMCHILHIARCVRSHTVLVVNAGFTTWLRADSARLHPKSTVVVLENLRWPKSSSLPFVVPSGDICAAHFGIDIKTEAGGLWLEMHGTPMQACVSVKPGIAKYAPHTKNMMPIELSRVEAPAALGLVLRDDSVTVGKHPPMCHIVVICLHMPCEHCHMCVCSQNLCQCCLDWSTCSCVQASIGRIWSR